MRSVILFLHLILVLWVIGCVDDRQSEAISLEERWITLYQKEGCLVGGQHWGPGTAEGSVFREKEWHRFFKLPSSSTVPFLMERLSSTKETKVHVCGFGMAKEGELAVYASEHILKSNWFECDSKFTKLRSWAEKRKDALSPLTPLILNDIDARSEIKECFLSQLK